MGRRELYKIPSFLPSNPYYRSIPDRQVRPLFSESSSESESAPESTKEEPSETPEPPPPPKSSSSRTTTTTTTDIHSGAPGDWEELHGNYILRPDPNTHAAPRALIHFLGGAFVGAAPDLAYRYILERLAFQGYLVVATPFNLSFDYLTTCDAILEKFEKIAPSLARQYGAVPVVGVGHSCGALLQLLITSLFPDTPRAANALISFNNKSVKDAVPLFEELIAPVFQLLAGNENTTDTSTATKSGIDTIQLVLDMARQATNGDLPSDELLQEFTTTLIPPPLQQSPTTKILVNTLVTVPPPIRDVLSNILLQPSNDKDDTYTKDLLPIVRQTIDVADQIPLLIKEVASGTTDFVPTQSSVRAAAKRAYRARRTLLLQYENDSIDESELVEDLLREAETIMRMKRPMVNMDLQRFTLKGNHVTPILAPPTLTVANKAQDILGEDRAKDTLLYREADETVRALVDWLEEGQL